MSTVQNLRNTFTSCYYLFILFYMEVGSLVTYKQITAYIKEEHGYTAQTCWIAHMKEVCELIPKNPSRVKPCPPNKQKDLLEAFKHFNMI